MTPKNKIRVALAYPVHEDLSYMTYWPPLGLLYLSSALKERLGAEVMLVDRNQLLGTHGSMDEVDRETINMLSEFDPTWIGIGAPTLLMPDTKHVATMAKKACPQATIVLGGVHPSVLPEKTLTECAPADIVVIGEGEESLLELVAGTSPHSIAGIAFRRGDAIIRTADRLQVGDLDALPRPAWELIDMEYYSQPSDRIIRGRNLRATHLMTTRGCPFACNFCAGSSLAPGVRYFSPERVLMDIEHLMAHYAIEGIYFADDMFVSNPSRAIRICDLMVERGIHDRIQWAGQIHSNMGKREVLEAMRRAGCSRIEIGVESGSPRILKAMNKNTTREKHLAAIRLCQDLGFEVFINIILAYPGEDIEDAEMTLSLVKETNPDNISVNRFIPLPGSAIFEEFRKKGWLDDQWNRYSVGNSFNFSGMESEHLTLYSDLMYSSVHFNKIYSLDKTRTLDGRTLTDREIIGAKNLLLNNQHIVLENLKRELVRVNLAWRDSQDEIRRLGTGKSI